MKRCLGLWFFGGLLCLPLVRAADDKQETPKKVTAVANFSLRDTRGKPVALADFRDKKAVAVVFIGVECPLVNLYVPRLLELHADFAEKGVQFLAINSNGYDSAQAVAEHAAKNKFPFPVLIDENQKVADLFQAQRTPEAFVLNPNGAILYHGRIDDQFGVGYQKLKPTRHDLADALTAVLDGKPVAQPTTEVFGCIIGREQRVVERAAGFNANPTITYAKHIAPVLQKHCQDCHRPGQIGPMSLLTYEKARAWSDTIREVVSDGRMPPWHADPRYGKFLNDRTLPKEAKQTLLAWIDQGCPKGDAGDMPPPRKFPDADGWLIGKPDIVFTMPEEFTVPAKNPWYGGLPYQFIEVPTNFTEDKWVQALECRAGNRAVVHHIIIYALKPGESFLGLMRSPDSLGNGLVTATIPGNLPEQVYAPGRGKRIPKGSRLLFQIHYTPNGTEQKDRSSVGFIFCKEPPKHEVRTRAILDMKFAIPPGDPNYEIKASKPFERDVMVLGYLPHMHLRGKDFTFEAAYPDGKKEILLSVPHYDFLWQNSYHLEHEIRLPAGSRINCTAHFDNSPNNKSNPDPTKTVHFGEMTWQEMMIGWLDYYYVDEPARTAN